MDDIFNDKLQKVLSDPDSLKTIINLASAIGGKSAENTEPNETNAPVANDFAKKEIASSESGAVIASSSHIPSLSSDDRVNLLLSIKPFLNNKKQQRVDSLVKALGAARLISTYKDSDIFGSLGFK